MRFHLVLATFVLLGFLFISAPVSLATGKDVLVCDIWPPYQMENRGELEGFSLSVIKAVYGRLQRDMPSISTFPWKRAVDMVMHNKAIGVFSINHTGEREVYLCYPSEPLIRTSWVIWTRGESLTSLDDLKGMKVGVVLGYSYTDDFWQFIETWCDVEEVHSDSVNFMKLNMGRLDAVVAEYGNGHHIVESMRAENIVPNENVVIKQDGLFIAFNRNMVSQKFVNVFSTELRAFKNSETYHRLLEKYIGLE